jgi:hypothetical protein
MLEVHHVYPHSTASGTRVSLSYVALCPALMHHGLHVMSVCLSVCLHACLPACLSVCACVRACSFGYCLYYIDTDAAMQIASGLVGSFVLATHKPTDTKGWQTLMLAYGCISGAAALLGLTFRPRTTATAAATAEGSHSRDESLRI